MTQNIDLLHERAGSREVVEVHGSIRTASCPGCGARYALEQVLELLTDADAPVCPECWAIVKPDVVFFGELLPPEAIDRAYKLARAAALMLVVGSALEVYPIAGCRRRRSPRAGSSRSSIAARRRTTGGRI